jgi:predicted SAM-dependent methyltransferase
MKKLHIGCGNKYLSGYIHVDIQKYEHVDIDCAIENIDKMFEEETIDEIYCCHILEHIDRHKFISVLSKLNKILKKNGKLYISVPDFESVVDLYNKDKNMLPKLYGLLYGGQRNEFDYHYVTFDFTLLQKILEKCGYNNVERYDYNDYLPEQHDDYSKCYIPHMDSKNGKLMSLNIVAHKKEYIKQDFYLGGVNSNL